MRDVLRQFFAPREVLHLAVHWIRRLAADRARAVLARLEQHRLRRELDLPESRGVKLLKEWLRPDQLAQFEARRYFDVIGSHSGKTYRIHYGSSMNVHELDADGRPLVCWCFLPDPYLVPGDVMLAQKIALETDEQMALTVANKLAPADVRFNLRHLR